MSCAWAQVFGLESLSCSACPLTVGGVAGTPQCLCLSGGDNIYPPHLLLGLPGDAHKAVSVSPRSWKELSRGGWERRPVARKARPDCDKGEEESSGLSQWKVLM